jgi:hypothetical protein
MASAEQPLSVSQSRQGWQIGCAEDFRWTSRLDGAESIGLWAVPPDYLVSQKSAGLEVRDFTNLCDSGHILRLGEGFTITIID